MSNIAIVGNQNGHFIGDEGSGVRDVSMVKGLVDRLARKYSGSFFDTSFTEKGVGISRVIGNEDFDFLFIIQNNRDLKIDVKAKHIFYFHVDGAQSIHPNSITHSFYLFNAYGIHDYKVSERQTTLYPFVVPEEFDPERKKDIWVEDIPRTISFNEYRDKLERSHYTIINAEIWLSKRAFQALACRTIPIIITKQIKMYRDFGFTDEFAVLVPPGHSIAPRIKNMTLSGIEKGYQWVIHNHSIDNRMEQIFTVINSYIN